MRDDQYQASSHISRREMEKKMSYLDAIIFTYKIRAILSAAALGYLCLFSREQAPRDTSFDVVEGATARIHTN